TFVASGPKLTEVVTQIRYTLQRGASGRNLEHASFDGVLQVPPGGTAQLSADAKASASVDVDATGPHGGTVQAVGDDRLEVVADGGDVHVYLLDAKLQPLPPPSVEGRTITITAVDETPHTITLTFDAT